MVVIERAENDRAWFGKLIENEKSRALRETRVPEFLRVHHNSKDCFDFNDISVRS
jgi:hypothetical protein